VKSVGEKIKFFRKIPREFNGGTVLRSHKYHFGQHFSSDFLEILNYLGMLNIRCF
jgi:hypothetical protein